MHFLVGKGADGVGGSGDVLRGVAQPVEGFGLAVAVLAVGKLDHQEMEQAVTAFVEVLAPVLAFGVVVEIAEPVLAGNAV